MTPEEALDRAATFLKRWYPKAKPEYVWSVVHHEDGSWLHLDVFDLAKQPLRRKYSRVERYRFAELHSTPVMQILEGVEVKAPSMLGRCKECTQIWRQTNGYGSEDDLDAIDDLPWYKPGVLRAQA